MLVTNLDINILELCSEMFSCFGIFVFEKIRTERDMQSCSNSLMLGFMMHVMIIKKIVLFYFARLSFYILFISFRILF